MTRFSAMDKDPTMPSWWRSSGMRAIPARTAARGDGSSGTPNTVTDPAAARAMPATRAARAAWPLPDTPAMPTISLWRTSSDASSRPTRPLAPDAARAPGTARLTGMQRLAPARGHLPAHHEGGEAARSVPATGRSATLLPDRRIATRSAIAMTSRSLCEMKMTDKTALREVGAGQRTVRRPPVASGPRWARRGRGAGRRDRAPSGSRPSAARRRRDADALHPDRPSDRSRSMSRSSSCGRLRGAAAGQEGPRPEHDVLEDRQALGQGEMLVHHADPGPKRSLRRARREAAEAAVRRRRPRSCPRRPRNGRRGCSSASSCRPRSPREARGSRRDACPVDALVGDEAIRSASSLP